MITRTMATLAQIYSHRVWPMTSLHLELLQLQLLALNPIYIPIFLLSNLVLTVPSLHYHPHLSRYMHKASVTSIGGSANSNVDTRIFKLRRASAHSTCLMPSQKRSTMKPATAIIASRPLLFKRDVGPPG